MIIIRRCPFTDKINDWELPVTPEQIKEWEEGMLAQDAFPHLTDDQREFIMTGITPDVWTMLFPNPMKCEA